MEQTEIISADVGLIVVKQLPVIEEKLRSVKPRVLERVAAALAIPVGDDTVAEIKKARAILNAELATLEEQRIAAKKEILAPYNHFEEVYKDCVSGPYKEANEKLGARVEVVEGQRRTEKVADVVMYFDEYAISRGIDWLTFKQWGINVTLSASTKQLKEQAKQFIDDVADDLTMIETQQYRDEVMVEYKKSLKAAEAIVMVQNRHVEVEKEATAKQARTDVSDTSSINTINEVVDAVLQAPQAARIDSGEPTYATTFTVTATIPKLRALKEFLIAGGYVYEQSN